MFFFDNCRIVSLFQAVCATSIGLQVVLTCEDIMKDRWVSYQMIMNCLHRKIGDTERHMHTGTDRQTGIKTDIYMYWQTDLLTGIQIGNLEAYR